VYPTKGDLVLISDGVNNSTCIILTDTYATEAFDDFYYGYCIETGQYGIIYEREIITILHAEFAPDFPANSSLFDLDSTWFEEYFYFPTFYPYEDDSTDDDDDVK